MYTMTQLQEMSGPALVEAWNAVAPAHGLDPVERFADRATGVKRIARVLGLDEPEPDIVAFEADAQEETEARKPRLAVDNTKAPREGSLVGAVLALLETQALEFEQVVRICEEKAVKVASDPVVYQRRAKELLHIIARRTGRAVLRDGDLVRLGTA